jgi:hypothetical protein
VRGFMICTDQVFSGDEIIVNKMGVACGRNGRKISVYIILMGKYEDKKLL